MRSTLLTVWSVGLACVLWAVPPVRADEGMWLFNNPPRKMLKEKYGAELTDAWLEKLQKSCVRIGGGGSGAFVSPDGLLVTNHHVALSWFSHFPGQGHTLVQDGFYAGTHAKEIKLPGLEVSVPWESEDVTKRVRAAIEPGMSLAAAWQAHLGVCDAVEKESHEKSGLDSEVEALYHGAKYRVTRYRTYRDVRLVFAPEQVVGYLLDCCFLRAYEDGAPAKTKHYLRIADAEPLLGDLVFSGGFPEQTNRHLESAHVDVLYGRPQLLRLKWLGRTEDAISRFAGANTANAWEALTEQTRMKEAAQQRWYALGPPLESDLAKKRAEERSFRSALGKKPDQLKRYGEAEILLRRALKNLDTLDSAYYFLESGQAFNSYLFMYGRYLLRLAEEAVKPGAERLPGYTDAWIKHVRDLPAAPVEISKNFEQVKLTESLRMYADWAGENDELLTRVLAGKSPEERARQLVHESRLDVATVRQKLIEGGKKALVDSTDPMIELARLVDGPARKARLAYEEKVLEPTRQAYAVIADIRACILGETYPDATGSLRLSFGQVRPHGDGSLASIKDMLAYLNNSQFKGAIPKSWASAQNRLDGSTRLWLRTSVDGAPGISGSPVVDQKRRLVGITARSYSSDIAYQEGKSGAYAVSVSGVLAFLETAYGASNLVKELGGRAPEEMARNAPDAPPSATPVQGSLPGPPPITPSGGITPAEHVKYVEAYRAQMEAVEKRNKTLLPALVKALKDSDKEVVDTVIVALGNIGRSAVPSLEQLLQSPDQVLRAHAATALGKIGPAGEGALPALLKALQDEQPSVRRESARAIAMILQTWPTPTAMAPAVPVPGPPAAPVQGGTASNKKAQSIPGWGDIIDPDGDCRLARDNGDVLVTIPKTHHDLTYANEQIKLNSPRILQSVAGDFKLRVKVRPFPLPGDTASSGGGQSFVSAGLVLWQDEKNFIRLERAALAGFNAPIVWFERFKDGKVAFDKFKVIADKDTGLQIVRRGNRFTFHFDEGGDDKGWTEFHADEFDAPATLRAGVLAINTTVREFPAKFSGLQMEAKK